MDEYRGLEADGVPSAGETPAGGTAAAIGGGEGLRDATRKTPLWRGVSGCFREVGGGEKPLPRPRECRFDSAPSRGLIGGCSSPSCPPSSIMHQSIPGPRVFGPFDGDFDPFEDDADATVLIPLERRPGAERR